MSTPPIAQPVATSETSCAICKLVIRSEERPSIHFPDGSEIHAECYKPLCSICHKLVRLEESKSDADGKAVHEQCYVLSISSDSSSRNADRTPARKRRAS